MLAISYFRLSSVFLWFLSFWSRCLFVSFSFYPLTESLSLQLYLSYCLEISSSLSLFLSLSLSLSLSVIFFYFLSCKLASKISSAFRSSSSLACVFHPLAVYPGILLFSVLDSYSPLGQNRE